MVLYRTETGDLRKRNLKRKAEDSEQPQRWKKMKRTEMKEKRDDSLRGEIFDL